MELLSLSLDDIDAAVSLARSVGWNDTADDWRTLFACGRVFGHKDGAGALVSTGAVCNFGEVAALAKMIVHASARGRGLARQLVLHALATRDDARSLACLVATDLGKPVYARLGFAPVGGVTILLGHLERRARRAHVVALDEADRDGLLALDRAVLGCDRARALIPRLTQARRSVVVRGSGGEIVAFGLAVEQRDILLVGPVLAPDEATALDVIDALVEDEPRRVRIDLPSSHHGAIEALRTAGLSPQAERAEMSIGGASPPGARARRFALLAQAYG